MIPDQTIILLARIRILRIELARAAVTLDEVGKIVDVDLPRTSALIQKYADRIIQALKDDGAP